MMNRAIKQILFLLSLSLLITACGRSEIKGVGTPKQEAREVKEFSGIDVRGKYQITGKLAAKQELTITSNENLLPYIETNVKSGILQVADNKSYDLIPDTRQLILFSAVHFDSLTLSGESMFQFSNVDTDTLTISLNGSHKLYLAGKAKEVTLTSSGSSNLNLKDLNVDKATVKMTGSGQIAISPSQELNVEINGSGTVVYFGKAPGKITQTINGSGKVVNGFGGVSQEVN